MKDDNPHWSADDLAAIAEQTLVLLKCIEEAEVCGEGSEHVYFEVIGNVLGDCDTVPDAKELARRLEEVQNDVGDPMDADFLMSRLDRESPYNTDTPEESHILERLTRHRIRAGEDFYSSEDAHYDHESRPPRCERIIEAISEKMRDLGSLEAQIDLLLENVDAFKEMHVAYLEVVGKHNLDTVRGKSEWLAGKSVEEIVDCDRAPINLSASLEQFSLSYLLESMVWSLQATAEEGAPEKFDAFLSQVPDAFFVEVRDLHEELKALMSQRQEFEDWIKSRAEEGIFRTEVMAEIDRRWAGSEVARRIGRTTLERLENSKVLQRGKKQGKLHFTMA